MNINQVKDIILNVSTNILKIKAYNTIINTKRVDEFLSCYFSSLEIILAEFKDLQENPINNIGNSVGLQDINNPWKWRVPLLGPKDTSYKDGLFYIEILFPNNYPGNSPEVRFLTPIYNLNVFLEKDDPIFPLGLVYFSDNRLWNPRKSTIRKFLIDLYAIFYWQDPERANSKMGKEYKENRALFEKKAKYFTKKYADPLNALKYCDQNWDFSFNEKDFELQESSELIHQDNIENNKKYEGNEKIDLCFSFNNFIGKVFIQCELKELTGDVFKRVLIKSGLGQIIIDWLLLIYNCRNLNPNISIGDNGLENYSTINVIDEHIIF